MDEQDVQPRQDHDALLERLTVESRRLLSRREVDHVELYHRMSRTNRVTHTSAGDAYALRSGCEEGIALRLWRPGDARVRFAAASGASRESIDRAADRALAVAGAGLASPVERCVAGEAVTDHDEQPAPPEPERLREWLARARAAFATSPGTGRGLDRAWIEVASTRETWVADGRPVASRERTRGWALVEPPSVEGRSAQPLILAERSWDRLDARDWIRMQAWRIGGAGPAEPGRTLPLLFSPEASATLVLTLVRSLPAHVSELRIGSGWLVREAPREPSALFGGLFDDLGFPTSSRTVLDGRGVLDRLDGPGHYRRPSFRDVPVCQPSSLVVEPPECPAPPDRWVAHRMTIHPLSADRWVLELEITPWSRGEPRAEVRRATFATGPRELLGCCTAGVGAAVASHRGVRTPALLFEGLPVKP